MKHPHILLVCLLCIAWSSCEKSEQFKSTTVSGEVINGITGEVFTRGAVELIELETPLEPFSPIIETALDRKDVDKNGRYSFDFKAKRGSRYSYKVEYDFPLNETFGKGDYDGMGDITFHNLEKKQEYAELNFRVLPGAEFKMLVYNTNEFDENDEISRFIIHEVSGRSPAGIYTGGSGYENQNHNDNANFMTRLAGHTTIEWHVTRNGQAEVFSDGIYLEHNEQRVYEIYY